MPAKDDSLILIELGSHGHVMLARIMGNKTREKVIGKHVGLRDVFTGDESDELIANESRILTPSAVVNKMDAHKPGLKSSSSKRKGDSMAEIRAQHEREFKTRITGPVTSGAIKWENISKVGTRKTDERESDKPNVNVKDMSNSKSEMLPWSEQSAVGKGKSRTLWHRFD
ncbi:hypothetical protein BC629DRAFT_1444379 [Irpex lacteus]|nr:hypothetical protein BC629DRAFT_1444379 [Irpex lacteus]